jgi:NAD(P)H-dependent FMN reductase
MPGFTVISGSTRVGSQSSKVATYVATQLRNLAPDTAVELVDLAQVELPHWHEGFWDSEIPCARWAEVSRTLAESDGIVLVSPEWNGMVPPALMNVFLLASRGELSHKPGLIVAVSAACGGAYPVAELRAFGIKNTQICYMPEHVIVRDANEMLNGPESASEDDTMIRDRIAYSLRVLRVYAHAFRAIRASNVIDLEQYPYGM